MSRTARPVPGQRYSHFKGNLYQIVTMASHSETGEEMVVYQALYGEFKIYICSLATFFEPVDKEKYPDAQQVYRFELVYPEEDKKIGRDTDVKKPEKESNDINPLLMQFLDADTYAEKLKIFLDMRESINEVVLTDVAASLDISPGTGTLEEQYASVQFALHTLAKYERNKR